MTVHADGHATPVTLPTLSGYDMQARAMVAGAAGLPADLPTLHDAVAVTRLIEAERQSAATGVPVAIRW
jgi:predicted dehydrogenase